MKLARVDLYRVNKPDNPQDEEEFNRWDKAHIEFFARHHVPEGFDPQVGDSLYIYTSQQVLMKCEVVHRAWDLAIHDVEDYTYYVFNIYVVVTEEQEED